MPNRAVPGWPLVELGTGGGYSTLCNTVCGVEMARPHGFRSVAEASTTAGMEYLMSRGVVVRFNQWRRAPETFLVRELPQPPISLGFYLQLLGNRYELWKKYGLPLPNRHQLVEVFRYLGVSHAAHEGFIHLMEHTYPPDILARIDRASLPWESLAGGDGLAWRRDS